jgi:hypothetical protein
MARYLLLAVLVEVSSAEQRAVSWWWAAPDSLDDPGVQAFLDFAKAHRPIITTVIMNCDVRTCCRLGCGECGNARNSSCKAVPRCSNNHGIGGVISGTLRSACQKVIPELTKLGIRSELWLGEDDSLDSARYLSSHPNETAAALIEVARKTPGITGFNIDLEGKGGTVADSLQFAKFLQSVTFALNSAPNGPVSMASEAMTPSSLFTQI